MYFGSVLRFTPKTPPIKAHKSIIKSRKRVCIPIALLFTKSAAKVINIKAENPTAKPISMPFLLSFNPATKAAAKQPTATEIVANRGEYS